MVILPAGGVCFEQLADRSRSQVLINLGFGIEESVSHLGVDRSAEPIVYNIDRKSTFATLQNRRQKIGAAYLTMQPFLGTVPHFELRRKAFHVFDDFFIYKRDAKLEAVGHGKLIGIHQQFVGKS